MSKFGILGQYIPVFRFKNYPNIGFKVKIYKNFYFKIKKYQNLGLNVKNDQKNDQNFDIKIKM